MSVLGVAILATATLLGLLTSAERSFGSIEEIVSDILPHCYVIKIQTTGSIVNRNKILLTPIHQLRMDRIPAIQIDLNTFNLDVMFNSEAKQIIRHQHQCVTFLISLDELKLAGDIERLQRIFATDALQAQAGSSYIIFHQTSPADDFQLGVRVDPKLLGAEFANFPKRILFNTHGEISEILQFCYYCFQGQAGFRRYDSQSDPNSQKLSAVGNLERLFPDPMRRLDGHTLRFTAPPAPPLVSLIPSKRNPAELEIVGMQEVILKSMAATLNFTFTLRQASGGLTGVQFPNGTWNGIMEEVLTGQADIGLSVATSYERNKVFAFTVPVFNAFLVLVSTKPSPFFNWEAIFYPFSRNAWLAIMACTILSVILFRFIHNKATLFEDKEGRGGNGTRIKRVPEGKRCRQKKMSIFKATHLTVGALLEQGDPLKIFQLPSRTFVTFWFLMAIVITCAYRSKLFLSLTFPIIPKPPSTFQELSSSGYKWGLKSLGGVGLLFITQSPLAHVRYIGEKLEIYTDKYTCLDRTVSEKYVCVIYKAYIDYMLELRYWNIRNKFYISDYLTPPVGSSWVLRKYSPLLPILDKFHSSQFEMGLADKYIELYQQGVAKVFRIQARNPKSKVDKFEPNMNFVREGEGSKPLILKNLYGSFFILFFGFGLGFLTLAVELLTKRSYMSTVKDLRQLNRTNNRPRLLFRFATRKLVVTP